MLVLVENPNNGLQALVHQLVKLKFLELGLVITHNICRVKRIAGSAQRIYSRRSCRHSPLSLFFDIYFVFLRWGSKRLKPPTTGSKHSARCSAYRASEEHNSSPAVSAASHCFDS